MEELFLVAGLGNPGPEYALTRHNAGFLALDYLGDKARVDWKQDNRFRSRIARATIGGCKALLCQPQTYMNLSGESVSPLCGFYKVPIERLLIVVDDADLPFGTIRLRPGGSSGGHHGLESVEKHLGSRNFARLRVGIGRTHPAQGDRAETGAVLREITGHVLGRFAAHEQEILKQVLARVASQIECFLAEGLPKAMSQFNGAVDASKKE